MVSGLNTEVSECCRDSAFPDHSSHVFQGKQSDVGLHDSIIRRKVEMSDIPANVSRKEATGYLV
jgi:hypothetical protein